MTLRRALPVLALASALLAGTSGCFGQDDGTEPVGTDRTPQEVMELAKETLDEAEGVRIHLYAANLPQGYTGVALRDAVGIAVRPASFEGRAKISYQGFDVEGEVIAIDDDFWVRSPILGPGYREIDPSEYGIPDVNQLLAPDGGISELLLANEDLAEGESTRGGANNAEVLTQYTGTIPGKAVGEVVGDRFASGGDYALEYLVAADGELREMRITGGFYGGEELTYVVNLDDYGATEQITAP